VKSRECNGYTAFIFYVVVGTNSTTYFSEAVTQKLFKDEEDFFCSGCDHYRQSATGSVAGATGRHGWKIIKRSCINCF
jgi:hypothetical protein